MSGGIAAHQRDVEQAAIDEVLQLDGQASAAPWHGSTDIMLGDEAGVVEAASGEDVARVYQRADRRLVARYRTLAPLLARALAERCAEVDRLREELARRGGRADESGR